MLHRTARPAVAIAAVATILFASAIASAGGRPFSTTLMAAEEVPGRGATDGSGTAHIELNSGAGKSASSCPSVASLRPRPLTSMSAP